MSVGRSLIWILEHLGYLTITVFSITFILRITLGDFSKNPHVNDLLKAFSEWFRRRLDLPPRDAVAHGTELAEIRVLVEKMAEHFHTSHGSSQELLGEMDRLRQRIRELEEREQTQAVRTVSERDRVVAKDDVVHRSTAEDRQISNSADPAVADARQPRVETQHERRVLSTIREHDAFDPERRSYMFAFSVATVIFMMAVMLLNVMVHMYSPFTVIGLGCVAWSVFCTFAKTRAIAGVAPMLNDLLSGSKVLGFCYIILWSSLAAISRRTPITLEQDLVYVLYVLIIMCVMYVLFAFVRKQKKRG